MAFTTYSDFNITGLDGLLLYTAEVVPIFIPLTLFVIFIVVTLGTFFGQRTFTQDGGGLASSLAVAAWLTTIIAFLMSLIPGLINTFTVAVTFVISIGTTVLLFASDRK